MKEMERIKGVNTLTPKQRLRAEDKLGFALGRLQVGNLPKELQVEIDSTILDPLEKMADMFTDSDLDTVLWRQGGLKGDGDVTPSSFKFLRDSLPTGKKGRDGKPAEATARMKRKWGIVHDHSKSPTNRKARRAWAKAQAQ